MTGTLRGSLRARRRLRALSRPKHRRRSGAHTRDGADSPIGLVLVLILVAVAGGVERAPDSPSMLVALLAIAVGVAAFIRTLPRP